MTDTYIGKPIKSEIRDAALDLLPNETARAVGLFLEGKTLAEVAAENGRTKKVTNDMKVAENLAACRLVNTQSYAVRRTERACRQMLKSDHLGVNTRKCLEYLRERALECGW